MAWKQLEAVYNFFTMSTLYVYTTNRLLHVVQSWVDPKNLFVQQGCNKTVNRAWKQRGVESSSCVPDKRAGEASQAMCDKGGYTSCDKK